MTSRFFELFCEMLDGIPAKAVIPAAAAERRMVEDDLAQKRAVPDEETTSVLSFCDFLSAAASGLQVSFPA
jgi:hypothetical protein